MNNLQTASWRAQRIQEFKPSEERFFVGDCMPFAHGGRFRVYWLLDEGHHSGLGGLGGHIWMLSDTADLVHWQHHPAAIRLDHEWEKSICTGSLLAADGRVHAFYATRTLEEGRTREHLSHAVSHDGGHTFKKTAPNPFLPCPAGWTGFRDPCVFKCGSDGLYHMLVTGFSPEHQGCLAHYASSNLRDWNPLPPLLTGFPEPPECPDYFQWGEWHYLLYSIGTDTQYLKSRAPFGPWEQPAAQTLANTWLNVGKTAPLPFGETSRRLIVYFRPTPNEAGERQYAGTMVFRELLRDPSGDLSLCEPKEMENGNDH